MICTYDYNYEPHVYPSGPYDTHYALVNQIVANSFIGLVPVLFVTI